MILLLDAGFANLGYAVVDPNSVKKPFELLETGVIKTVRDKSLPSAHDSSNRVAELFRGLKQIAYRFELNAICAEYPHGGAKSSSAIKAMSFASAVITCFATSESVKLKIVSPMEVKKTIRPKGKVEKEEIMSNVSKIFPDYSFPKVKARYEHVADAISVGLALKKTGEWSNLACIDKYSCEVPF
jgi:Holliday junction resolvasome RuvABC endonuclease subunit